MLQSFRVNQVIRLFVAALCLAMPASAQSQAPSSQTTADLRAELERLQQAVKALEEKVAALEQQPAAAAAPTTPPVAVLPTPPAVAAPGGRRRRTARCGGRRRTRRLAACVRQHVRAVQDLQSRYGRDR